ncbi:hypothetical protein JHK85_020268 [Glycine max]|nr:hypothetical protein JHK85_020268 [Glycine max]KAG5038997.1 hypothetical protein JHK86_019837 [Glycine max]
MQQVRRQKEYSTMKKHKKSTIEGTMCPKMKTYRRRTKKTVHLSQELINEILLRLPVKSLVRFKCVSEGTERLVFFEPSAPEIRSIDFNASLYDDSASVALKLNFLPPKPYDVRIRGFHGQLAYPPIIAPSKNVMFLTFLYGFWYDPSTDDYLVVKVFCHACSAVSAN